MEKKIMWLPGVIDRRGKGVGVTRKKKQHKRDLCSEKAIVNLDLGDGYTNPYV